MKVLRVLQTDVLTNWYFHPWKSEPVFFLCLLRFQQCISKKKQKKIRNDLDLKIERLGGIEKKGHVKMTPNDPNLN